MGQRSSGRRSASSRWLEPCIRQASHWQCRRPKMCPISWVRVCKTATRRRPPQRQQGKLVQEQIHRTCCPPLVARACSLGPHLPVSPALLSVHLPGGHHESLLGGAGGRGVPLPPGCQQHPSPAVTTRSLQACPTFPGWQTHPGGDHGTRQGPAEIQFWPFPQMPGQQGRGGARSV